MTILIASIGAGSVLTMYIMSKKERFSQLEVWMGFAIFCLGIGFSGLSFLDKHFSFIFLLFLGILCGIGTGIAIIVSNYCIQTIPKEDEVSAIAGIYQSLTSTTVFASPLIGAYFISIVGVKQVFLACGLSLILLTCLPILLKVISTYRGK